jgi:hypothetical protein
MVAATSRSRGWLSRHVAAGSAACISARATAFRSAPVHSVRRPIVQRGHTSPQPLPPVRGNAGERGCWICPHHPRARCTAFLATYMSRRLTRTLDFNSACPIFRRSWSRGPPAWTRCRSWPGTWFSCGSRKWLTRSPAVPSLVRGARSCLSCRCPSRHLPGPQDAGRPRRAVGAATGGLDRPGQPSPHSGRIGPGG